MKNIAKREILAVLVLIVFFLFVLIFMSTRYQDTVESTRDELTVRVMDTIQPFQDRHLNEFGVYAIGAYDARDGDFSLEATTGWTPSTRDHTSYFVELIGQDQYRMTAISPKGTTYCRLYPEARDCTN